MKLTHNETVVATLTGKDGELVTLTTSRIRYEFIGSGYSNFISMTLDSIATCGLLTKSHPILVFLSLISACFAFFQNEIPQRIGFVAAGLCFFVAYFVTRRGVVQIASNGGERIQMPFSASREKLVDFLNVVEEEKLRMSEK